MALWRSFLKKRKTLLLMSVLLSFKVMRPYHRHMSRVLKKAKPKPQIQMKMWTCTSLLLLRKLAPCTSSVRKVCLIVSKIFNKKFRCRPIDGRKPRPIPHGTTSRETFMEVGSILLYVYHVVKIPSCFWPNVSNSSFGVLGTVKFFCLYSTGVVCWSLLDVHFFLKLIVALPAKFPQKL